MYATISAKARFFSLAAVLMLAVAAFSVAPASAASPDGMQGGVMGSLHR